MIVMVNARLFNPAGVYYDRFQGGKQDICPKQSDIVLSNGSD